MHVTSHQYIARTTSQVVTEKLYGDGVLRFIYSTVRENAPLLFKLVTSSRMSSLLSFVNFDLSLSTRVIGLHHFIKKMGVDLTECIEHPLSFDTPRKIFERKIRYWETRPMVTYPHTIVSPADSKVLCGSLCDSSRLFIKNKFFDLDELLGVDKKYWQEVFTDGAFAIFRLTPEKYHYNHAPVAGRVVDIYEISGAYHSCNPQAVLTLLTPHSKNKRVVTIIDTDVEGGTRGGLVAMVEIGALMVGDIVQCYSEDKYDNPRKITPGMFLHKGLPKSLFRPGSSTDVLIFEKGKITFCEDLIINRYHQSAQSRFSLGFGTPLVETEVAVRSLIATAHHSSRLHRTVP